MGPARRGEGQFPDSRRADSRVESQVATRADQEIRTESKSWTAEQWESYLATLEVGLKESQPRISEVQRQAWTSNIFDLSAAAPSEELTQKISELVSTLTERQKFIIGKIFWDGLSERQVAKMMGISRQGVFDLKKRALRRLKKNAHEVLANFPIVRARVTNQAETSLPVREGREKGEVSC